MSFGLKTRVRLSTKHVRKEIASGMQVFQPSSPVSMYQVLPVAEPRDSC